MQASAAEGDKPSSSAGRTKSGLASLMQRAVQHAKAEAAAQAAAGTDKIAASTDSGQSREAQKTPEGPANGKKALASALRKAAQKMQEAEAETQLGSAAAASNATPQDDSSHDAENSAQSGPSSTENDALAPDQVQLAMLSPSSSRSDELQPLEADSTPAEYKPPSLGSRLGSLLQQALSPSRQPSYIPVDADSPPEADALADGSRRRALPRDASLGQKLGSLLKGALSLPRQTSYIPVGEDAEIDPSDSSEEDSRGSPVSKDLSLPGSHGSLSLSGLSGHIPNNAGDVLPRELSFWLHVSVPGCQHDLAC